MNISPNPLRRMRSGILTALAILFAGFLGTTGVLQAYTTFCGTHPGLMSSYMINPNFSDAATGSAQDQIDALNRAADEWTTNGESQFQWFYNGQSTKNSVNTSDGTNVIYADPGAGGSTLAETWCASAGGQITGWDMLFYDGDKTWATNPTSGQYDLEGVAVHEFGHALGLGHSASNGATMFPSTGSGQSSINLRSIENDDKAGIQFLYGTNLDPPTISNVQPDQGYVRGGETVTVTGTNFVNGMKVLFDNIQGEVLNVNGTTEVTVRTPKGNAIGAADVRVQQGSGSATLNNAYAYLENPMEITFTGTPRVNKTIQVIVYGPPNSDYVVAGTPTQGPAMLRGLNFCFARDGNLQVIGKSFGGRPPVTAKLDSTGEISLSYTIPNDQSLVFQNVYIQGVLDQNPSPSAHDFLVTNCLSVTVFP